MQSYPDNMLLSNNSPEDLISNTSKMNKSPGGS